MGGILTCQDLLYSCPPTPAAVTGWSVLQHCICSGTPSSSSLARHIQPAERALSIDCLLHFEFFLLRTPLRLESKNIQTNKSTERWKSHGLFLLGVHALFVMTSLKLGWEFWISGQEQLRPVWRFLGNTDRFLRRLFCVIWFGCAGCTMEVTHSLLGYRRGERETREVGLRKHPCRNPGVFFSKLSEGFPF